MSSAAALATAKLRSTAHWQATDFWWELELAPALAADLPDGYELLRIEDEAELTVFRALPPEDREPRHADAHERLAAGGVPWALTADGAPAFTCWTFLQRGPIGELRSGWLELPTGVAMLEDSITAREHRGKGLAWRAWRAIGAQLRDDGYELMITRVRDTNDASNRAVEKAGFTRAASMRARHIGPRQRLWVIDRNDATPTAAALAERLDRQGRWGWRGRETGEPALPEPVAGKRAEVV